MRPSEQIVTLLGGATPSQFVALKQLALAARNNNPHVNGLMASPPAITTTTSTVLTQTASWPDARIRFTGGTPVFVSPGYRVRSAIIAATGGNLGTNNGAQASYWRAGSNLNANIVDIRVGATTAAYRVIVDGQYTSYTGYTTVDASGTAAEYIHLDFTSAGGKKARNILVEGQNTCSFVQFRVAAGDTISALTGTVLRGIIVGDSYTYGSAAIALGDGYAPILGDFLGILDLWASGSGGTGWGFPASGAYQFGQRLTDWTNFAPDFVLFHGSINDSSNGIAPATVTANAISTIQATRAALPNTIIVVIGAFAAATGPNAAALANEAAMLSAFNSTRDRLMIYVPVSNISPHAMIYGTGFLGSPNGTGNSDTMIYSDATHPTNATNAADQGHIQLGTLIADAIIAALH